ncbi:MAG: type IV pilus assembly protein PilM [Verrucomicrobium sp.]|jgi:type IV pilus assembly protein PilM|nr:type IV pilus assembly protein PilM [Verrucomicrobium sp.]
MLKAKTFLGIDFGAGTLKVAEFEPADGGGLKLLRFGTRSLGLPGSQDAARDGVLKRALTELLAEGGFVSRQANISAPGYQVFSKFVKLPPVDASKISQIIQYEAQQNVPFPLTESAWDHQILGTAADGAREVLLVAIKADVVEKLFAVGESVGLKMEVVDASMSALANAFRYNYGDVEGCSVLIDIGAKTSNVLLFEANKFYVRTVPVGANTISQEYSAESKTPFAEAEKFKIAQGFVSLGGAYEEPDDPKVAAVSKVARNVLTRLHMQVNQTIQFYRTQQGGSAPQRVFLCGGGSVMAYSAEFFQEKLNLPVEYFSPFRNVQIDPSVNVEELERSASMLGEVVGLGLRNIADCPVELNLLPKSSRARQEFNSKKPYLVAAAFVAAAGVWAAGLFYAKVATVRREGLATISEKVEPLARVETSLKSEEAKLAEARKQADQLGDWLHERAYWPDILAEIRRVLRTTEIEATQKLGVPVGVWLDTFYSTEPPKQEVAAAEEEAPKVPMMSKELMMRYGLIPRTAMPSAEGGEGGGGAEGGAAGGATAGGGAKAKAANTNEVSVLTLNVKAVNLQRVKQEANGQIAYDLEKLAKASPLFDASETQLSGQLEQVEDSTPTFSFPLKVKLKRPIKL